MQPFTHIVSRQIVLVRNCRTYPFRCFLYRFSRPLNPTGQFLELFRILCDTMEEQIQANYWQIKQDIIELIENELIRIENDPELKHLLGGNEGEQA